MKIPGSNLLGMASRLINFDRINRWTWTRNDLDGAGILQPVYTGAPIEIRGSVQPVPRAMYETLGLDLQKNYFNVFTSATLSDLQRDKAPDMLDWNGRRFIVESNTDWKSQDGWRSSICCDIGPTPP